jgi:hypothetical protein
MEMALLYLPKSACVQSAHMHCRTAITPPPPPTLVVAAWAMLNPLQENDITETNNRPNPGICDEAAHVTHQVRRQVKGSWFKYRKDDNAGVAYKTSDLLRKYVCMGLHVIVSECPCKQHLEIKLNKPK